jgi:hypothetical protein
MCEGLRRAYAATRTWYFDAGDTDSIDRAIAATVLYGNPYSPGIPGWVAICTSEYPSLGLVIEVVVSLEVMCQLIADENQDCES